MRNRLKYLPRSLTLLLLVIVTVLASPGAASADQFRNGRWIYGSIEREFVRFLNPDGSSRIGEPNSDELLAGADGRGRWQAFGFDTNRIVWSPDVDPNRGRQMGGLILTKWLNYGTKYGQQSYERGRLGYPTTAEEQAVGGRYNNFQGGAITYQNGATQAFATWGDIRSQWASQGYETGPLGFPTTDEYQCSSDTAVNGVYGGWGQTFANGNRYLTAGAAGSFARPANSVVNSSLFRLNYTGTTKYTSALDYATSTWNNEGLVAIQRSDQIFADLTVSDYDAGRNGTVGFYSKATASLQFNDAYLGSSPYNTTARRNNLVTHEFGHALGMGHSCQTAVMDPVSSNVTQLNIIDKTAYRSMWGRP